jgi:hypothetical protein
MNNLLFVIRIISLVILIQPFIFYLLSFILSIDFNYENLSSSYWEMSSIGVFISAVILTISSISKKSSPRIKLGMTLLSPIFGITAYAILIFLNITLFGFGKWVDVTLVARSNKNPKILVVEQWFDNGALGFDGNRFVERRNYWHWGRYTEIDTSKVNWKNYEILNKEIGLIKFP